jgi:gliding motility-associated-like protein
MVNFPGFKGAIYDRYGKLIFEFTPKTPIWDGLFQGKRVPTDSYWYLVNWELGINKIPTKQTGWILLKNKN